MGQRSSKVKLEDIDADGDGVITRTEVHNYVRDELQTMKENYDERMEEWKSIYEQKLDAKDENIQNLKDLLESQLSQKDAEIEEWKQSYNDLYDRYSQLLNDVRKENYEPYVATVGNISQASVEKAVEGILSDPNLNLKKVPDWIERKLYFNIVWIILIIVQRIIGSVKVGALGHEFSVIMNPDE